IMELGQAKALSGDEVQRLLLSPNPDVEHNYSKRNAQFQYVERLISDFQEYDHSKGAKAVVPMPDPIMDLEAAIHQMELGYVEMLGMDAPYENKALAKRWIDLARKEVQKVQAQAQQAQQPPAQMQGSPAPQPPPAGLPQLAAAPSEQPPVAAA